MKITNSTPYRTPDLENSEDTERNLLALRPTDPHVRKMIEIALQGLREGVPRLTPEEIFDYLGRQQQPTR